LNITGIRNNQFTRTNTKQDNTSFKSAQLLSSTFMAINKHEMIGVSAIDLLSMVIPRSAIDFTRNKEAGIETAIRESSSTATHAAIGVSGLGAAALLAQGLKHKNYGVDFKAITANDDTVDGLAEVFKNIVDTNKDKSPKELRKIFLEKAFEDVKGLGGNTDIPEATNQKIWFNLSPETKKSIVDNLDDCLENGKSFKLNEKSLYSLEARMHFDIPSTQNLKIKLGTKEVATKGEHYIADVYSLAKSFTQKNVLKTFNDATDVASNSFVRDLKKLSIRKTTLGLAAICAVALSMQTLNRYLTKKRTGIDGFVGDPNYNKKAQKADTQTKTAETKPKKDIMFTGLKLLSVAGMGFFIFKTLNANSLRDFISKVQFKGNLPTVNQIKVVYGSTIMGRLFAASDKNELRESCFRDFLGYTNFLVIGGLITKWFVNKKDKSLINYDAKTHGAGIWNWIKNSSIKTHEEVVNSTLKGDVLDAKTGLVKPLKELYHNNWIQPNGTIAKKLAVLNKAKLLGMGYACVALGIIVPLINKYMTEGRKNKIEIETTKQPEMVLPDTRPSEEQEKIQQIITDYLHRQNIA